MTPHGEANHDSHSRHPLVFLIGGRLVPTSCRHNQIRRGTAHHKVVVSSWNNRRTLSPARRRESVPPYREHHDGSNGHHGRDRNQQACHSSAPARPSQDDFTGAIRGCNTQQSVLRSSVSSSIDIITPV